MRPEAIFVNAARGGLVDEPALLDALESGRLRAAALDVFEREPPRLDRLRQLHNLVMTPHLGGISEQSVREMTRTATASVLAVLRNQAPHGVVNVEALDRAHASPATAGGITAAHHAPAVGDP
jgi:phosphogluconate 2-dehydrogenase